MVNNAHVTKTDIAASNGVIHVIDTVLLPRIGTRMHSADRSNRVYGRPPAAAPRTGRLAGPVLVPESGGAALARSSRHGSSCAGICSSRHLWARHLQAWTPLSTWSTPCIAAQDLRPERGGSAAILRAAASERRRAAHRLSGRRWPTATTSHLICAAALETGNILRSSGVPVVEFQASIVIGSGSASFELIRALVERLPVMITPRWVNTAAQPIAIEDVIEYLVGGDQRAAPENVIVEIGGSDVTSYVGIMREFARQRKLRRWFLAFRSSACPYRAAG